ncbi:hypothetical protein GQR58_008588 [Nymphon striatum]|nr:hypothetical protein GQR58_008588 [Nymphon striatum]
MNCLVDTVAEPPTLFDVKVLDGAAVVHMLSVNAVGTFIEYANSVFLPHVVKQLDNCQRIDVVWDTYFPNSIKESTREKRGKGVRRKVLGNNKIAGNWNAFLCDPTNKQELFSFLSDIIATADLPSGKVVAITCGEKVEMNGGVHLMETCDHEEADTRILIHLQDALQHGATTCLVRTVDTDVIVILIGKFYYLLTICPSAEIWVAFGTGKDFRCKHTVSSFYGRGKKTAWQAWKAYKEVTEAFVYIASNPFEMLDVTSRHFEQLERYCIILYDKTSSFTSVNDTRKELFCKRNKTIENLPPTQDALINHTKRALYQAGIWTSSQKPMQHVPSPADWGWTMDADGKRWVPVWRTLDVASKACKELVKCNCKSAKGCTGHVSQQGGVNAQSFADATARHNASNLLNHQSRPFHSIFIADQYTIVFPAVYGPHHSSFYISNYKRFLLTSLPNDTKNIHFCCDRYYANSLKTAERASRGETGGKVYEVSDQIRAPDPKAFFDVSENKAALLEYLCDNWVIGESVNPHQSIKLFLSGGFRDIHKSVLLTNGNESPVTELQSTHEEADTRLLLHSIYATQVEGVKRIVMYANDTDVIVLAVYYYKTKLKKLGNATDLKRLPSTEDAFLLHLERSAYACIIDKTAHIANPVIPEPTEYGWISEGDNMIPHQMRNPSWPADAAKATNCSCKKECQRNCSCSNASRRCNIGCLCRGHPDTCKRARLQEELEQELENESSDEESSGSSEGELED